MKKNTSVGPKFFQVSVFCLIAFSLSTFSAYSQQMPKMNSDSSSVKNQGMKNMDMPMNAMAHPFFTHMGMPQAVGRYNLRFAALATQMDGKSQADFGLQFETGLSKIVGLLVRLESDKAEIMFHFLALKSKNGMNGLSPLIEFEIPTHEGVNTQVGFSSTLSNPMLAFHQVIHYGVREKNVEGSVALVLKISKSIFLITELLGEKKQDESGIATVLAGFKIRVNDHFRLGFGIELPVTDNRDFSSRFIFQPDLMLRN